MPLRSQTSYGISHVSAEWNASGMESIEIINAVGTSVGAVAAVGAAAFAGWGIQRSTNDNRARSQPFMTAEFATSEHSDDTIRMLIRNVGQTPARNVRVSFDPPIPEGEKSSHAWVLHERYDTSIPMLAPGQQFGNSWWLSDFSLEDPSSRNVHELPNEVKVSISYTGIGGEEFSDDFELNARLILLEGRAVSSTSMLGRMEMIAKSNRDAAQTIKTALPRIVRALEDGD